MLLLEGTENEFVYTQALHYNKDDIEKANRKIKYLLLFEPDDAKAHTNKSNINFFNNYLFLIICFKIRLIFLILSNQWRLYLLL